MLVVGLVMAPQGLVMMATAPLSARLSRIKGPKVTLMAGAVTVAAGYGLSVVLMSAIWQLVLVSCVIGAVPVSETAAANSLNTLMRAIGTSISSAVIGVILAQLTTTFGAATVPSHDGFRVVMVIGCGAALLALAIASLLPRARPAHPPAPTRPQSGR